VCDRTLQEWMMPHTEAIGSRQGSFFAVAQVEVIFEKLGMPYKPED